MARSAARSGARLGPATGRRGRAAPTRSGRVATGGRRRARPKRGARCPKRCRHCSPRTTRAPGRWCWSTTAPTTALPRQRGLAADNGRSRCSKGSLCPPVGRQGLGAAAGLHRWRASGRREYVLLTDADIRHVPGSLRRLVAESEAAGLALNSRMARLRTLTGPERLLIPAFVFFFNLLYPMRRVNDPGSGCGCRRGLRAGAQRGARTSRRAGRDQGRDHRRRQSRAPREGARRADPPRDEPSRRREPARVRLHRSRVADGAANRVRRAALLLAPARRGGARAPPAVPVPPALVVLGSRPRPRRPVPAGPSASVSRAPRRGSSCHLPTRRPRFFELGRLGVDAAAGRRPVRRNDARLRAPARAGLARRW